MPPEAPGALAATTAATSWSRNKGPSGMPLYEYLCDACGPRFEPIRKFSDPPLETCPHCGGHVQKLMSSPAIQFKGSGFYITDYPKGEKGTAPKSDGGKADREAKGDKSAASTEGASKTDKSSGTETT